jgi:hypothetical protein
MWEFQAVRTANKASIDTVDFADMFVLQALITKVAIGAAPIAIRIALSALGLL